MASAAAAAMTDAVVSDTPSPIRALPRRSTPRSDLPTRSPARLDAQEEEAAATLSEEELAAERLLQRELEADEEARRALDRAMRRRDSAALQAALVTMRDRGLDCDGASIKNATRLLRELG